MKRFLLIISLFFVTGVSVFAQDDDDDDSNDKIQDKMSEFIQKRLDLSKDESAKFTPVFLRYFKEWRQTIRENRADKLERQKKIIDLRLKYRAQFREIIGEKRGNQVFGHQDTFIREVTRIRLEERRNNPSSRPLRRM
jgi:thiamine kinase-like enzyme